MQEAKYVPHLGVASGGPTKGSVSLSENGRDHVSYKMRLSSDPRGEKMSLWESIWLETHLGPFLSKREGALGVVYP